MSLESSVWFLTFKKKIWDSFFILPCICIRISVEFLWIFSDRWIFSENQKRISKKKIIQCKRKKNIIKFKIQLGCSNDCRSLPNSEQVLLWIVPISTIILYCNFAILLPILIQHIKNYLKFRIFFCQIIRNGIINHLK